MENEGVCASERKRREEDKRERETEGERERERERKIFCPGPSKKGSV